MKKILLIDAFGIIFRSYYAFISRPLTNRNGENVSAIHGFFRGVIALIKKESPDYILIALEGRGECVRNKIYPDYKANRDETPVDLKSQIVKIIDLIEKLGLPHYYIDGYEADDIIGTAAAKFGKDPDNRIIIFSSDKDLKQLVTPTITLCRPDKTPQGFSYLDPDGVIADTGIKPDQMVDYLALIGDASDNIPGVKGIGPKTAVNLLTQWESLDGVYKNLANIKPDGVRNKLESDKNNALLSATLAKIYTELDIGVDYEFMKIRPINTESAFDFLNENGLKSVIDDITRFNKEKFNQSAQSSHSAETRPLTNERAEIKLIKTEVELNELVGLIRKEKIFSYDLETTGLNYYEDDIICMSFGLENGTFVVPVSLSAVQIDAGGITLGTKSDPIAILKGVFEDKDIAKIGHNIKFDNQFMRSSGVNVDGDMFDTMLAVYVLDAADNVFGLKDLGEKYLGQKMIRYSDLLKSTKDMTLRDVTLEEIVAYSGQDAFITYKLYEILKPKMAETGRASDLFSKIEIPLLSVLSDMEYTGVLIDKEYLLSLSKTFEGKCAALYNEMMNFVGVMFNPNSPIQLREILFEKLQLPIIKKTKTGPSTDTEVLNKLKYLNKFPELLLEYRMYSKLNSTYTVNLVNLINPKTGKIHTTYQQTGTQTGRLSSQDPNLQNIPIKTDAGREIRRAFLPSPGNVLVSADYSQIELFLLAEFSGDPNLGGAFKNSEDIHRRTASLVFGKAMDDISKVERSIAKAVNFGILYGQQAYSLSQDLNIPAKEAQSYIDLFFKSHPNVAGYVETLKQKCRETGFAETFWGRRRTIPEINDRNKLVKANGDRAAVNTVIQGTAADLVKLAMIKVYREFKNRNFKSKLILQVHDELIFDVVPGEKDDIKQIIKSCMTSGFGFNLELKINIEEGNNWGELH